MPPDQESNPLPGKGILPWELLWLFSVMVVNQDAKEAKVSNLSLPQTRFIVHVLALMLRRYFGEEAEFHASNFGRQIAIARFFLQVSK